MPDSYYPPKFWVEALNSHTQENERFGPFEGFAQLTFENLIRANNENGPEFLFTWVDPQDTEGANGDPNPHGYESWTGIEGDTRFYGWRRSHEVIDKRYEHGHSSHQELRGPFYTDLTIVHERE
jgi:hypothetical protein